MKKVISKKVLVLLSLLLFLPLFSGCFLTPSVNQTPTITSTPITTATVDELYTYDVDATDPDGDTLTYSLTTNPSGMTINSATGVINWTPSVEGDYDVIVEVSDGEKSTTQSFTITVSKAPIIPPSTPTNHAPTITSTPIITVAVDEPYTYDVEATDYDNDILTYSLTTNPAGMTIDSVTGEISWTPISSQIGDNDVTVKVSDGEKYDAQSFRITVADTVVVTFNPIALTSIIVDPKDMTLFVGEDGTLTSITASYNYGPDKPLTLADCSYSSDNETVATVATGVVTGVSDGSATITISYEENGITKTDIVAVTVNPLVLTSIAVLPNTMTLFVGEDDTLTSITASYNYGPDKDIALADCSYSSNNEVIATVDTGVVTGEAQGSAIITVSYTEGTITKEDTVVVTVNPIIPPNLELLPHTQNAKIGESFSINVEVENVTDLLGASITLNFDHVAMPFLSATPGSFFSNADVLADLSGPLGSITLWLDSVEEPASGTGTIMIVSFVAAMKGNNYPITFGVTELRDKDNKIIVHTTGSDCKVHIKKP